MTHRVPMFSDTLPLHKEAQRLRWFIRAFHLQMQATSEETGNTYNVSEEKLADVFAAWLNAFERQKPTEAEQNAAYVGFAAGLMLRELIRAEPVSVATLSKDADDADPAYFWPEGYLYVAFCLNVRGLVLNSDYQREQHPAQVLHELRTWWSFKENVGEDPSLAIPFLDLFSGDEPNWRFPQLFRARASGGDVDALPGASAHPVIEGN
ncbi:hypothetical protein [Defluviimonas sp. WL0075]|uniref:Uncharacterized protein n=1 Tax=Albidovulum sediminicola TaxID=2984331 RepID=A0ABT2Z6Z4_9RHOB|nr:hypothetical protein [Defluviimonas sp. WL0075]MCV2866815.1 hypothetical protein [Defluviimonas sp. WL0075]